MERDLADHASLERLVELVDEDFADRWHLVRSRRFCLFFLGYCIVLGIPLVLMFQVFFYVTDRQLGVAVIGVAIAFLAIGVSFLTMFVSSGVFDRILREDWFARTCRSDEFKRMDTARNRLLAWALISMRDRIHPSRLAEVMEGAPTLLQDEILLRDALLRE
jgi:hypothetical protein